jgi:two-component system response regulator FlrC
MTQLPILLVEDDLNLREALAETLGLADYQVRVAADGEAALQILARVPVVAVVTDYQMKPMDGYFARSTLSCPCC